MLTENLFQSHPKDYFNLFNGDKVDSQAVNKILKFKKVDVAKATKISKSSVRYDDRMPQDLEERIIEWALIINKVYEFFQDEDKVKLWIKTPHPLFSYITPRDLIKFGKARKLIKFIDEAMESNKA